MPSPNAFRSPVPSFASVFIVLLASRSWSICQSGMSSRSVTTTLNHDLILQGVGRLDVIWIVGIDECTDDEIGVRAADLVSIEFMSTGFAHCKGKVVLINDMQAHVPAISFR